MRKIIQIALVLAGAFLFAAAPARAQFTTVSGTVKDPNGIPYANGTITAVLTPATPGGYRLQGQPYSGTLPLANLDTTGSFALSMGDNGQITPASSQWTFEVCSNPGGIPLPLGTGNQCFNITVTITGATQSISSQLQASAPSLTNFTGAGTGTVSGQQLYSIPVAATATTLPSILCAPPSVNGFYQVGYDILASAPVSPGCYLVGLIADAAAGATVLSSDNNNVIYNPPSALALPTPATLGNPNFFTVIVNNTASTVVLTPATWTVSLNGGAPGSSASLLTHQQCSVSIDQTSSTQWDVNCLNIGNTPSTVLATGIVDGTAPVTITTGTTANLGATYLHGYTFNQEGTAGTGVTYTLPATAAGKQYCVANSGTTGVINTGALTVYPASGSYVILNGVVNTVGGGGTHGVASGGAAGDGACFVAIDSTHWQVYVQSGTWTEN